MKNKDNELIFEQYVKPRNTNNHQTTTIVEAIDRVMRLPRVKIHGKTLVSEEDIVDVLKKLKASGLGKVKKDEMMVDPQTGEQRIATDDDVAKDVESTKGYAREIQDAGGDFGPGQLDPDFVDTEETPEDGKDQAKLDVEVVEKLAGAANEDGQIDLVVALRIIAGE